jgi:hypothetical protein
MYVHKILLTDVSSSIKPSNMKQDMVYKDCSIRMSNNGMANFMYAVLMTSARVVSSFGLGIDRYTRKQNAYNFCDVRIEIKKHFILQFEELSGVKLREIEQISGSYGGAMVR